MVFSESDTRSKLIDPKIKENGWSESHIVREYYFTDGRKLIGGKRGKSNILSIIYLHIKIPI